MEPFFVLLALCAGNSLVPGDFPAQRPVTRSFFFDLRLNKRLRKQSWGWWFETPSRSLWRHINVEIIPRCFKVPLIPFAITECSCPLNIVDRQFFDRQFFQWSDPVQVVYAGRLQLYLDGGPHVAIQPSLTYPFTSLIVLDNIKIYFHFVPFLDIEKGQVLANLPLLIYYHAHVEFKSTISLFTHVHMANFCWFEMYRFELPQNVVNCLFGSLSSHMSKSNTFWYYS